MFGDSDHSMIACFE